MEGCAVFVSLAFGIGVDVVVAIEVLRGIVFSVESPAV